MKNWTTRTTLSVAGAIVTAMTIASQAGAATAVAGPESQWLELSAIVESTGSVELSRPSNRPPPRSPHQPPPSPSSRGNNGVGNGQDPPPPGNPPENDGPGTSPGNPGNKGGTPGKGNGKN